MRAGNAASRDSMSPMAAPVRVRARQSGRMASLIGALGGWFIYRLIWLFGRTHRREDIAWLIGPMGGSTIGDAPYHEVAAAENLTIERDARDAGLVPDFSCLRGDGFEPGRV